MYDTMQKMGPIGIPTLEQFAVDDPLGGAMRPTGIPNYQGNFIPDTKTPIPDVIDITNPMHPDFVDRGPFDIPGMRDGRLP